MTKKKAMQHNIVLDHTEISCTVCLNTFHTPLTLVCGHTFCFACICACIRGGALHCPLCRLEMTSFDIFETEENKLVKSLVEKCRGHRKLNASEESKLQYWKSEKLKYLEEKKNKLELRNRASTHEPRCRIYNKLEPYVFCMGLLLLLVVLLELSAQVYLVTTRAPTMMDYNLENSRMDKSSDDGTAKVVQPLVFGQSAQWSNTNVVENYESFCEGKLFCPKSYVPDTCESTIRLATCRPMTQDEKDLRATFPTDRKATAKTDMMATRHMGVGTPHGVSSGKTFAGGSNNNELAEFFIDAAATVARKTFLPPNYMMVMLSIMDKILLNNTFSSLALEAVIVDPVPNLVNATKMLLGL